MMFTLFKCSYLFFLLNIAEQNECFVVHVPFMWASLVWCIMYCSMLMVNNYLNGNKQRLDSNHTCMGGGVGHAHMHTCT